MPRPIHPRTIALMAALTMALLSASAWAQDGRGGRHDRGGPPSGRNGGDMPQMERGQRGSPRDDGLSDSVRRIERSTRGQVLSAERMQSDGRDVNRIKVKDDRGRVRVYMDDPQRQSGPPTRDDDN